MWAPNTMGAIERLEALILHLRLYVLSTVFALFLPFALMPPKKGIVKSGNAGNSSKTTKPPAVDTIEKEKPLFPPGFKYPLSLLHERYECDLNLNHQLTPQY